MPTTSVNFSRPILTFDTAWSRGEPQLLTNLATRITGRTHLKVVLGMEILASKPNGDGKDTTIIYPKTRPIPIYSIDRARQMLQEYKDTLGDTILETIEKRF